MKKPSITFPTPLQVLSRGYLLVAMVWVVFSLYRIFQAGWTTLTKDQWRIYTDYFSMSFPENILKLQNGHPTVFPGFVRLADIHLATANNQLILAVGLIFTVAVVCVISWIIWQERERSKPFRLICISLSWIVIFWLANIRILGHDPILSYSIATLSFCGAIWSLIRAEEAHRQGRSGRLTMALLAASLGCFVATFSFGSGITAWLAIIIVAVLLRLPLKKMGLLGTMFVVTIVLRTLLPGRGLRASALSFHPVEVLKGASTWLGAPVFHIFRGMGLETAPGLLVYCQVLGGIALVAVILIILKKLIKPRRISPLEVWSLAMILFGTGIAFQVAIGRARLSPWVAPRYLPWVCLFWLGLILLLGLYAHRRTRQPTRQQWQASLRGLWLGFVCLLPLLLLPAHRMYSVAHGIGKHRMKETALGLVVGVHDDQRVRPHLFRNPDLVYQLAEELRARHLAMFSWDVSPHMGESIDEAFDIVEATEARGQVLKHTAFPDGDRFGARIEGWAVEESGRVPRYVVVTNGQGRIQGLAQFTRVRRGIARRLGLDPETPLFFFGYIKDYVEEAPYRYYAILSDGRSAVLLGDR